MRSRQWNIIGTFLIVMGSWFIVQDFFWAGTCDFSDDSPVTNSDIIACVNNEILDPFIWFLIPLGLVFFTCGQIELRAGRKQ